MEAVTMAMLVHRLHGVSSTGRPVAPGMSEVGNRRRAGSGSEVRRYLTDARHGKDRTVGEMLDQLHHSGWRPTEVDPEVSVEDEGAVIDGDERARRAGGVAAEYEIAILHGDHATTLV